MESDDDEFETSRAPLPPHDRTWRHPSEVASWNSHIQENLTSPPPLSRRLSLFTTTVSAAIALAIIVIAVPRGVGTETSSDTTASVQDLAPASSTVATTRTRNTARNTPAVRVSDRGIYVAAIDELPSDQRLGDNIEIALDSNELVTATISVLDSSTGLAVLSSGKVAAASATSDVSSPGPEKISASLPDSIVIVELATGVSHTASIGVSMAGDSRVIPLDGAQTLTGLGVVRDANGTLLGVALRHHHATKLVTTESIDTLVTTMLTTSSAP